MVNIKISTMFKYSENSHREEPYGGAVTEAKKPTAIKTVPSNSCGFQNRHTMITKSWSCMQETTGISGHTATSNHLPELPVGQSPTECQRARELIGVI